jgi:hypothetical protein
MRKTVAAGAGALVILALSAAGALAVTLPTFKSDLIVPNKSVAGVTLKSTYKQAIQAFRSGAKGCSTTKGCSFRASNGATFSVLFARETQKSKPFVAEITVEAGAKYVGSTETPLFDTPLTALKTAQGIGLGSTLAAVKRAYPHAVGSAVRGLEIKGHGAYETHFNFTKGHVTLIAMQGVALG